MENAEKKPRWGIIFLILFLLIFTSPIFYFGVNLSLGIFGFKKIEAAIERKDFSFSQKDTLLIKNSFARAAAFWEISKPIFSFLGQQEKFNKVENTFSLVVILAEGAEQAAAAMEQSNEISKKFLKGGELDVGASIKEIQTELAVVSEKLSLAQILLNDFSGNEPLVGFYTASAKSNLSKIRSSVSQAQEIAAVLPAILGMKERKTYLVLFQNNMELRPTGGFIGSYGLVILEEGRMLDFEIQDVYFADGQLKGHVEAPQKVKEFLGESGGWYLRDSNWDPDFPISASQAEWFLEKETGRKVDGVIGINLFVVQRILEDLGDVTLPDYRETINSKNFFERAQFHNEVGFFPGSRQKKDFLATVAINLWEKLKSASEKNRNIVALSLLKSLEEKDIVLYFNNGQAERSFTKFNWDGGIKSVSCRRLQDACMEDYLMLVEANVGVNKANYFLSRSLELNATINQEGQIYKKLTIFYENKSPSTIFPGGTYRNYLRVYVPDGSLVGNCQILNLSTQEGQDCKIEGSLEHQKKVLGFLVETPAGEKSKVELNWQLLSSVSKGHYFLLVQKQSGARNDNFILSFSYPSDWKVYSRTSGGLTGLGKLVYNTQLDKDKVFELEIKGVD